MSKLHEMDLLDASPRSDRVDAWDMDVHVGSVLGKYRLLAELGQGGMSNVFLAVARGPNGFNKLVVLKMLRPSLARDPQFLSMFLDEARLAARLNHPNVVQTNEVGVEEERHLIAMEYLEGQPLSRILQRCLATSVPMSRAMHLRVLADALNGLHYAHELTDFDGSPLHLVHRDVSPQNIFVTYDGQVKVLDFGIAKAATSSVNTTHGVVKGKVAYMSPEQFAGDPIDRRADVFGMGVLIWECATGTRMWKKKSDAVVLQAVLGGQIPSPRTVKADVDERFEVICKRALALHPVDRYPTAYELQHDVEQLIDVQPERVTHRDLGKFVSELFKEERSAVRTIVEKQLTAAKRLPTGEYAALGFAPTLASGPVPRASHHSGARPISRPDGTPSQILPPPGFPSMGEYARGSAYRQVMDADLGDMHPPRFTGSHAAVASTIRPPRMAPGAWRLIAAVAVGACAFAFGGFYWAKTRAPETTAPAGPQPAPAPRGEVAPPPEPVPVPTIAHAEPPAPIPSTASLPEPPKPAPVFQPQRRPAPAPFTPPRPLAPTVAAQPAPQPTPSAQPTSTPAPQPTHRGRKFRTEL